MFQLAEGEREHIPTGKDERYSLLNQLSNLHRLVDRVVVIAQPDLLCPDSLPASRQARNRCKIIVGGEVPEESR